MCDYLCDVIAHLAELGLLFILGVFLSFSQFYLVCVYELYLSDSGNCISLKFSVSVGLVIRAPGRAPAQVSHYNNKTGLTFN